MNKQSSWIPKYSQPQSFLLCWGLLIEHSSYWGQEMWMWTSVWLYSDFSVFTAVQSLYLSGGWIRTIFFLKMWKEISFWQVDGKVKWKNIFNSWETFKQKKTYIFLLQNKWTGYFAMNYFKTFSQGSKILTLILTLFPLSLFLEILFVFPLKISSYLFREGIFDTSIYVKLFLFHFPLPNCP